MTKEFKQFILVELIKAPWWSSLLSVKSPKVDYSADSFPVMKGLTIYFSILRSKDWSDRLFADSDVQDV